MFVRADRRISRDEDSIWLFDAFSDRSQPESRIRVWKINFFSPSFLNDLIRLRGFRQGRYLATLIERPTLWFVVFGSESGFSRGSNPWFGISQKVGPGSGKSQLGSTSLARPQPILSQNNENSSLGGYTEWCFHFFPGKVVFAFKMKYYKRLCPYYKPFLTNESAWI